LQTKVPVIKTSDAPSAVFNYNDTDGGILNRHEMMYPHEVMYPYEGHVANCHRFLFGNFKWRQILAHLRRNPIG